MNARARVVVLSLPALVMLLLVVPSLNHDDTMFEVAHEAERAPATESRVVSCAVFEYQKDIC